MITIVLCCFQNYITIVGTQKGTQKASLKTICYKSMYVFMKCPVKIIEIAHTHVYTGIIIILCHNAPNVICTCTVYTYNAYNNVNTNVAFAVFLKRPMVYT